MADKTVYVVNKGAHDFDDAERFGRLVYLSEGPMNKFSVDKMYREFATRLRDSSPEDYILITGLTVMACIACSSFSFLHGGRLNLLLFKNNRYIERTLRLDKLLTTEDSTHKQIEDMVEDVNT